MNVLIGVVINREPKAAGPIRGHFLAKRLAIRPLIDEEIFSPFQNDNITLPGHGVIEGSADEFTFGIPVHRSANLGRGVHHVHFLRGLARHGFRQCFGLDQTLTSGDDFKLLNDGPYARDFSIRIRNGRVHGSRDELRDKPPAARDRQETAPGAVRERLSGVVFPEIPIPAVGPADHMGEGALRLSQEQETGVVGISRFTLGDVPAAVFRRGLRHARHVDEAARGGGVRIVIMSEVGNGMGTRIVFVERVRRGHHFFDLDLSIQGQEILVIHLLNDGVGHIPETVIRVTDAFGRDVGELACLVVGVSHRHFLNALRLVLIVLRRREAPVKREDVHWVRQSRRERLVDRGVEKSAAGPDDILLFNRSAREVSGPVHFPVPVQIKIRSVAAE